jgi:hypothetical protein
MMDGDGTLRHLKYPGGYNSQPAGDIAIYRIIRGEWNQMRSDEMKRQQGR